MYLIKISVSVQLLLTHLILYLKNISQAVLFQPQDAGVDTGTVGLTGDQHGSSRSVLALRSNNVILE